MTRQFFANSRLPGVLLLVAGIVLVAAGLGHVYQVRFHDAPDSSEIINDRDMVIQATTGGVTREEGNLAYTRPRKKAPAQPPDCAEPSTEEATVAIPPPAPSDSAEVTEDAGVSKAEAPGPAQAEGKASPAPATGDGKDACPT